MSHVYALEWPPSVPLAGWVACAARNRQAVNTSEHARLEAFYRRIRREDIGILAEYPTEIDEIPAINAPTELAPDPPS